MKEYIENNFTEKEKLQAQYPFSVYFSQLHPSTLTALGFEPTPLFSFTLDSSDQHLRPLSHSVFLSYLPKVDCITNVAED